MKYFLVKTDPETYSIDDLQREGKAVWDGVHNYQAIACIKTWKIGDKIFVYHSQNDKKIMGMAEVISEPYENKRDSRMSWIAQIKYVERFKNTVSLAEIKEAGIFLDFKLVTNPRLSVMECPDNFVEWIKSKV